VIVNRVFWGRDWAAIGVVGAIGVVNWFIDKFSPGVQAALYPVNVFGIIGLLEEDRDCSQR
jgi:hypothetical protein